MESWKVENIISRMLYLRSNLRDSRTGDKLGEGFEKRRMIHGDDNESKFSGEINYSPTANVPMNRTNIRICLIMVINGLHFEWHYFHHNNINRSGFTKQDQLRGDVHIRRPPPIPQPHGHYQWNNTKIHSLFKSTRTHVFVFFYVQSVAHLVVLKIWM